MKQEYAILYFTEKTQEPEEKVFGGSGTQNKKGKGFRRRGFITGGEGGGKKRRNPLKQLGVKIGRAKRGERRRRRGIGQKKGAEVQTHRGHSRGGGERGFCFGVLGKRRK